MKTPTLLEFEKWFNNPTKNPQTNKKIKLYGKTFNRWITEFDLARKNRSIVFESSTLSTIDKYNGKETQQYIQYRKDNVEIFSMEPTTDHQLKSTFKFYHTWDPYNGNRQGIDPHGPLLFDANALIHYWYVNRLNHLWNDASDDTDGLYHGYYGYGMGNGPDFNIKGRGNHMDWYLFRLPIVDCYLPQQHNNQIVTMGPMLNNDEINMIYSLAKKTPYCYDDGGGAGGGTGGGIDGKRPNLSLMKKHYDQAITMRPTIVGHDYDVSSFVTKEQWDELRFIENKKGIVGLMNM